jgi:hypothetical protein
MGKGYGGGGKGDTKGVKGTPTGPRPQISKPSSGGKKGK